MESNSSKSKKRKILLFLIIILLITLVVAFMFVFKNDKKNNKCDLVQKEFNVIYNTSSDFKIDNSIVNENSDDLLPIPERDSYKFDGWYYDEKLEKKVEGNSLKDITPIKDIDGNNCIKGYNDINIYAKWILIDEKNTSNDVSNNEKPSSNKNESTSTNKKSYSCSSYGSSYKLVGTKCIKYDYKEQEVKLLCDEGGILESDKKCHFYSQTKQKKVCQPGYLYDGVGKCYKSFSTTEQNCVDEGGKVTNQIGDSEIIICFIEKEASCPAGYVYSDNTCHRTGAPYHEYYCSDGYEKNNNKCLKIVDTKQAVLR